MVALPEIYWPAGEVLLGTIKLLSYDDELQYRVNNGRIEYKHIICPYWTGSRTVVSDTTIGDKLRSWIIDRAKALGYLEHPQSVVINADTLAILKQAVREILDSCAQDHETRKSRCLTSISAATEAM